MGNLSNYMHLIKEGDGRENLHGSNETLSLSFTIQRFLLDVLTPLPLRVPESICPPSPVSEFLQRPLDVHSMSDTCHSQIQEVVLGERRQMRSIYLIVYKTVSVFTQV